MDKMPVALNLKQFVKNTIEFMDEIVRLNKMWENDIIAFDNEGCEEDNGSSDIEIIEIEQGEQNKKVEYNEKESTVSSDEDIIYDEEIIKTLKDMKASQELTALSEEDLKQKMADLKHQLSNEDCEDESGVQDENSEISADFNVDKLKELTAFVSQCGTKDADNSEDKESTDDEGKFSDGDDENQKVESEEILKSFVREISEERKKEKIEESDEGEISP